MRMLHEQQIIFRGYLFRLRKFAVGGLSGDDGVKKLFLVIPAGFVIHHAKIAEDYFAVLQFDFVLVNPIGSRNQRDPTGSFDNSDFR